MNTTSWIGQRVQRLLPGRAATDPAAASAGTLATAPAGAGPASTAARGKAGQRGTRERLSATLRQGDEAMSPRMLRRALDELRAIIDPRVSEVEGGRRAEAMAAWYAGATPARRRDLWLLMSEMFVADPKKTADAQARYAAALGTPDEAAAEVHYRRATVSPRRRLLQRFSVYPGGVQFLVDLRAEIQPQLKGDKRLLALDVEMEYMFSTWFDVGFLDLRRISWDSPASLIEKLIQYEAVHEVKSWADMKNRLDSDRRCYGFFHPRLPGIPLIFVEVALVDHIAPDVVPLLDESAAPADLKKATTAIFYSISNTQVGLRGVSFGDSLIKNVVDTLRQEFPQLKTFATLSPIPGLRGWLQRHLEQELATLSPRALADLGRAVGFEPPTAAHVLPLLERPLALEERSPLRQFLLGAAARYLGTQWQDDKPLDPVARFHLGNGARVERLNWAGDPSAKGLKQSFGLMVNYLYDLKRLDRHRALLSQRRIPMSGEVEDLLKR